jgi:membrane protease YdiL (CAAX protease family)
VKQLEVPWRAWDAWVVFLLSWIGLPILMLLALKQLASLPLVAQYTAAIAQGDLGASFAFDLVINLAGLGVVAYFLQKYQAHWSTLGLRRFKLLKAILIIFGAVIAFGILVSLAFSLVAWLYPSFNADQVQANEFTEAATNPQTRRLSFIALVLIPPVIEEIIFRGFIFPAFSKKRGVIFGAITSSLLFGLAHLQGNVTVYTIVLGLLLCLMYVKLRSIVPGMVLHMINNYLAFMALTSK